MKVLQVINCLVRGGGAEHFLMELALQLKQQNVEVEVLSIIAPAEDNRDLMDLLEKAGITVRILTSEKLRSWKNFFNLRAFLKVNSYDIVHGHLFPTLYFCAFISRKNVRWVYTEHSTDNRRRHKLLFHILDSWVYRRYNKIVCISEKVRTLLALHVGTIPSVVIPNGIRTSLFFNATPASIEELIEMGPDVKYIAMCARFVKGKDYMTLFKALQQLPLQLHLLCIGTGPLEAEYRRYVDENQLTSRVHFLGLRKDVPNLLKRAEVIVLSSEHEGFSLSMLEAMASGRPFVASAVPGIVDLVDEHALLFPFEDDKALASCILLLLTDRNYWNEMSEKSLRFAEKYDIVRIAQEYKDLYYQLLSAK